MGNLVNPVSMRLGNTLYWSSQWISYQNHLYSFLLSSDYLLYSYLDWFMFSNYFNKLGWILNLSHYKIVRFSNQVVVLFFFKDYRFFKFITDFFFTLSKYGFHKLNFGKKNYQNRKNKNKFTKNLIWNGNDTNYKNKNDINKDKNKNKNNNNINGTDINIVGVRDADKTECYYFHKNLKLLDLLDTNFNLLVNAYDFNNIFFFNDIFYFSYFYDSYSYIKSSLYTSKDLQENFFFNKTYSGFRKKILSKKQLILNKKIYLKKKLNNNCFLDKILKIKYAKVKFLKLLNKKAKKIKKYIYYVIAYKYPIYYIDRHNVCLYPKFFYYRYKQTDLFFNNYHMLHFNFLSENFFLIPEYYYLNLFNDFTRNILISKPFDYVKNFNINFVTPHCNVFIFKKILSNSQYNVKNFFYNYFFFLYSYFNFFKINKSIEKISFNVNANFILNEKLILHNLMHTTSFSDQNLPYNTLIPINNISFINLNYTFFFVNIFLFICLYLSIFANYHNYIKFFHLKKKNKKNKISFISYIKSVFFINNIFYNFNLNIFLDFFSDFFQNFNMALYFELSNVFNITFIKTYCSLIFSIHIFSNFSDYFNSATTINCVFLFSNFLFYFFLFKKNYLIVSVTILNIFKYKFYNQKKFFLKPKINIIFLRKYFINFFNRVRFLNKNISKHICAFKKNTLKFFLLFNFNFFKIFYKKNLIFLNLYNKRFSKNYILDYIKLTKNFFLKKNKKNINVAGFNKNTITTSIEVSSICLVNKWLKKKKIFFFLKNLYYFRRASIKFLNKKTKKYLLKPFRFLSNNHLYFLIYGFKSIKQVLAYCCTNQQNSFKFFNLGTYTLKNFLKKILKDLKFSLNSWFIFNKFNCLYLKRLFLYFNLNLKNILLILLATNFQKWLLLFLNNVLLYFFDAAYVINFYSLNLFLLNKLKLFLTFFLYYNIEPVLMNYLLLFYDCILKFINTITSASIDKLKYNFNYILFIFYYIIINWLSFSQFINIINIELIRPRLFFFRNLLLLNILCKTDFSVESKINLSINSFLNVKPTIFFKTLKYYSYVNISDISSQNNKQIHNKKLMVKSTNKKLLNKKLTTTSTNKKLIAESTSNKLTTISINNKLTINELNNKDKNFKNNGIVSIVNGKVVSKFLNSAKVITQKLLEKEALFLLLKNVKFKLKKLKILKVNSFLKSNYKQSRYIDIFFFVYFFFYKKKNKQNILSFDKFNFIYNLFYNYYINFSYNIFLSNLNVQTNLFIFIEIIYVKNINEFFLYDLNGFFFFYKNFLYFYFHIKKKKFFFFKLFYQYFYSLTFVNYLPYTKFLYHNSNKNNDFFFKSFNSSLFFYDGFSFLNFCICCFYNFVFFKFNKKLFIKKSYFFAIFFKEFFIKLYLYFINFFKYKKKNIIFSNLYFFFYFFLAKKNIKNISKNHTRKINNNLINKNNKINQYIINKFVTKLISKFKTKYFQKNWDFFENILKYKKKYKNICMPSKLEFIMNNLKNICNSKNNKLNFFKKAKFYFISKRKFNLSFFKNHNNFTSNNLVSINYFRIIQNNSVQFLFNISNLFYFNYYFFNMCKHNSFIYFFNHNNKHVLLINTHINYLFKLQLKLLFSILFEKNSLVKIQINATKKFKIVDSLFLIGFYKSRFLVLDLLTSFLIFIKTKNVYNNLFSSYKHLKLVKNSELSILQNSNATLTNFKYYKKNNFYLYPKNKKFKH